MKSLYELLGAGADDDAAALKKAFRKAVKAHHPDFHPDDLDAQARYREIIAAHALLRDPKQRASYDRLLQLEREHFQLTLARDQLRSKLARQQLRLKRMRAAAVIAAAGALIGGYGLWATLPTSGNVEVDKDELGTATGVAAEEQTATVVAAAKENENPSAAIGAAKADAVKGDNAERELALGPESNNANFYKERGIASYRSGDFAQAIVNFNAAIRLDPDDAQAYNLRGNAWDEMGFFKRALADYDEAIRIDPNNPAIFHDRAILWQRKGELDKALIDLDRAIRFNFSDVHMYCDRGLVWYEKGHHDRAIADFNHAIKLDPDAAGACIKRGVIVHRNSQFKLALATVNQAIRVDPSIFDVTKRAKLPP